jgi:hypothetical protein
MLYYHIIWIPEPFQFTMGNVRLVLFGATLLLCVATSESVCPNQRFLDKHFCGYCANEKDALAFSQKRQAEDPTGVNTVFTGKATYYFQTRDQIFCANTVSQLAYKCFLLVKKPYCIPLGYCFAKHYEKTSHLDHQNMVCKK